MTVGGLRVEDAMQPAARARVASMIRQRLLRVGLTETVREWVAACVGETDEREHRRLVQLATFAARVENQGPVEPQRFIELVEQTDVPDEAAAPIQVMNIHQSKGLEFDFVVLGELDGRFGSSRSPLAAFDRPDDGSPPQRVIRWIWEARRSALPAELAAIFDAQKQREGVEALCLLYVAMTRARRGLTCVVEAPRKGASKVSWAKLLQEALVPEGADASEAATEALEPASQAEVLVALGDREATLMAMATPKMGQSASMAVSAAMASVREHLPPAEPTEFDLSTARTLTAPPSADSEEDPAAALRIDPILRHEAIDRGTALHVCFAVVKWLGEFVLDEAGLLANLAMALPRRNASWLLERVAEFRAMLEAPGIREALARRAAPSPQVEVLREAAFLRLTPEGVQRGTIDRLVLWRHQEAPSGPPIAAEIVDFKTGRSGLRDPERLEAWLAERTASYRGQLRAYAEAVVEQWRVPPEAIETTLVFVDEGVARRVRLR